MYVQTKLQFQAVLDQVFPEYRGVFGDLHSYVPLLTLQALPILIEETRQKVVFAQPEQDYFLNREKLKLKKALYSIAEPEEPNLS